MICFPFKNTQHAHPTKHQLDFTSSKSGTIVELCWAEWYITMHDTVHRDWAMKTMLYLWYYSKLRLTRVDERILYYIKAWYMMLNHRFYYFEVFVLYYITSCFILHLALHSNSLRYITSHNIEFHFQTTHYCLFWILYIESFLNTFANIHWYFTLDFLFIVATYTILCYGLLCRTIPYHAILYFAMLYCFTIVIFSTIFCYMAFFLC